MGKIILSTLVVFMILTNAALAFDVKLINDTDQKLIFNLIWLECNWEGFPTAQIMVTGEIHPKQEVNTGGDWKPGRWALSWGLGISYLIEITSKEGVLSATPNKLPIFTPKGD